MSSFTPRLLLPYVTTGVGDNLAIHNRGLQLVESLLQRRIVTRQLSTPPGILAAGDAYLVKATGTGSWLGKDNNVAYWTGTGWEFLPPKLGMQLWAEDESCVVTCVDGTNWKGVAGTPVFGARKSGTQTVSTTVDARLDVEWNTHIVDISDSAIFEHDTSTDQERIIIRESGMYQVECGLGFLQSGSAGAVRLEACLQVGTIGSPSDVAGSFTYGNLPNEANARLTMHISELVALAANEEIRVQCTRKTNTSPTINLQAESRIIVRKVRE